MNAEPSSRNSPHQDGDTPQTAVVTARPTVATVFSGGPPSLSAGRSEREPALRTKSGFGLFRRMSTSGRRFSLRRSSHEARVLSDGQQPRGEGSSQATSMPEPPVPRAVETSASGTAAVLAASVDGMSPRTGQASHAARSQLDPQSSAAPTRTFSLPPTLSEKRSSLPDYGDRGDGNLKFYMQLHSLKDGSMFAGRYKLEAERVQGRPHCRFAVEKCTGQRVFLKFFPHDCPKFDNVVAMYNALNTDNRYVNKMIERIESIYGFPPCIVFERGDYRLSDRMAAGEMSPIDQRAVLYSVLEALDYLHSRGITHGNLKPSHVLWFGAECSWKLVDLEYGTQQGRAPARHEVGRYASPELIQAQKRAKAPVRLTPAADIWAFGVIAFEVLTCSSVSDSAGIMEYIERRLQLPSTNAERTLQRWLSANPRGRAEGGSEEQSLRFIQTLLQRNPEERRTAGDALGDTLFRSATDVYQRMDSQGSSVSERQEEIAVPDWVWTIGMIDRLEILVDVEYLPTDAGAILPFHLRTGEQAWMFDDDYLPSHPVFYIRLGETYRLHVRVTPQPESDLVVQRIIAVTVKPPDFDSVTLTVEQRRRDDAIVALALFQPKLLGSERLQTKSPSFGTIEEKYIRLDVGVKLLFGEPVSKELEFHKAIYCRMIEAGRKLRFHKFIGMIKNENVLRRPFEME